MGNVQNVVYGRPLNPCEIGLPPSLSALLSFFSWQNWQRFGSGMAGFAHKQHSACLPLESLKHHIKSFFLTHNRFSTYLSVHLIVEKVRDGHFDVLFSHVNLVGVRFGQMFHPLGLFGFFGKCLLIQNVGVAPVLS